MGPLPRFPDVWTKENLDNEVKTTPQYVPDLRSQLEETATLAVFEADISSRNCEEYYDLKTKHIELKLEAKL